MRNAPRMLDELAAFSVVAELAYSQMKASPSGANERLQIRLCRHPATHK